MLTQNIIKDRESSLNVLFLNLFLILKFIQIWERFMTHHDFIDSSAQYKKVWLLVWVNEWTREIWFDVF